MYVMASIIGSGINGNVSQAWETTNPHDNHMASIIGSGINGNV